MRLIDADALYDKAETRYKNFPTPYRKIYKGFVDDVAEAPTIEAAPVVHGKWVDKGWDGDFSWRIDGHGNCWKVIQCSVCEMNLCGGKETPYCPMCGAKMDLWR